MKQAVDEDEKEGTHAAEVLLLCAHFPAAGGSVDQLLKAFSAEYRVTLVCVSPQQVRLDQWVALADRIDFLVLHCPSLLRRWLGRWVSGFWLAGGRHLLGCELTRNHDLYRASVVDYDYVYVMDEDLRGVSSLFTGRHIVERWDASDASSTRCSGSTLPDVVS